METSDGRLGAMLSRHSVDNRRRWITGGIAGAVVVVAVLVIALLVVFAPMGSGFGKLSGYVLFVLLAGLPFAAVRLAAAIRGGNGEVVELHEHGIAHRVRKGTRQWTWRQVESIRVLSLADEEGLRLSGLFGRNYQCTVRFTDGSRLRVDGMIDDCASLMRAVAAHRPDAISDEPAPWKKIAVWVLPVVILACVAVIVWLIVYIAVNDGQVETSPGVYEAGISDSEGVAIAIGMLGTFTAGVLTLVVFITAFTDVRRHRK